MTLSSLCLGADAPSLPMMAIDVDQSRGALATGRVTYDGSELSFTGSGVYLADPQGQRLAPTQSTGEATTQADLVQSFDWGALSVEAEPIGPGRRFAWRVFNRSDDQRCVEVRFEIRLPGDGKQVFNGRDRLDLTTIRGRRL